MAEVIKSVRDNPPASVAGSWQSIDRYRTLYDDIVANGTTIQYVDRHALGELAVTLCQMDDLRNSISVKGTAMEVPGDRAMVTKRNPDLDALQKLYPVMMKLFSEFKMTPNSRGKQFGVGGESKGVGNDGFGDV